MVQHLYLQEEQTDQLSWADRKVEDHSDHVADGALTATAGGSQAEAAHEKRTKTRCA